MRSVFTAKGSVTSGRKGTERYPLLLIVPWKDKCFVLVRLLGSKEERGDMSSCKNKQGIQESHLSYFLARQSYPYPNPPVSWNMVQGCWDGK